MHAQRDRLHVELNGADYDQVMNRLKLVFGIQNFSPSIKVDKTFEATAEAAAQMIAEQVDKPITFTKWKLVVQITNLQLIPLK